MTGALLLLALAQGAPLEGGPSATAVDLRNALSDLSNFVEVAVDRAARGASLPGAERCRGYRVPGTGVVVVVPPRRLPLEGPQASESAHGLRAVDALVQLLESDPGPPPEVQARMRHVLLELRRSLQRPPAPRGWAADAASLRAMELEAQRFEELAADAQARADDVFGEALQDDEADPRDEPPAVSRPAGPPVSTPPAPRIRQSRLTPWDQFLAAEQPDRRDAQTVIEQVRLAAIGAIETRGAALPIGAEEWVVVTVDFEPFVAGPHGEPQRTLVVRLAKRDLDLRAAGQIDRPELVRRAVTSVY